MNVNSACTAFTTRVLVRVVLRELQHHVAELTGAEAGRARLRRGRGRLSAEVAFACSTTLSAGSCASGLRLPTGASSAETEPSSATSGSETSVTSFTKAPDSGAITGCHLSGSASSRRARPACASPGRATPCHLPRGWPRWNPAASPRRPTRHAWRPCRAPSGQGRCRGHRGRHGRRVGRVRGVIRHQADVVIRGRVLEIGLARHDRLLCVPGGLFGWSCPDDPCVTYRVQGVVSMNALLPH